MTNLPGTAAQRRKRNCEPAQQPSFFEREDFPLREATGYYRREEDWMNRVVGGDRLPCCELTLLCQSAIAYICMEGTRYAAHLR